MRRLSVRLPDPAHERLRQHAHDAGLPIARAATALLCTSLDQGPTTRPATAAQRPPRFKPPARPANPPNADTPPWLPSETDPHWAQNTWGAILALYRRYPDALRKLEHDWHEKPERVEVLAALAHWRATIDAAAEDPREELAFHNALQQLSHILGQTGSLATPFSAEATMPADFASQI